MKFRYKVLITNLILLSVSLGLVGYLMIHKNFELAKETQISNAVIQNNLVQSSVEYEVLQALNREESVKGALPDIGAVEPGGRSSIRKDRRASGNGTEKGSASYIFSEGRRLERMSGKLFDLIYLREHEMEKEAVQVENVSSEVLKVVIPSFEAKGLVLKENIEPAVLYGNKELLVVLTGIFLPGILIEGQERKAVGE